MPKQPEIIDAIYPKGDKLQGKEVDYLLRSATLICSCYAYHRKVLPHTAFKFVRVCDVRGNPVFDASNKKAKQHKIAIQSISPDVEAKMIRHFLFGLCDENDPENVVETLRFHFDYNNAAMNILLPNATNVRVSSKWDFGDDLNEVLKRVRILSSYLSALPAGVKSFLMVQYNKRPDQLPKDFDYHNEYDIHRLQNLPLARFPCDTYNTAMIVEIRSKFFDVPVDDIRKDVESALLAEDEEESDDSDSTPPQNDGDDNDGDDDEGDDDDVQVIEDSLEKEEQDAKKDDGPRKERTPSLEDDDEEEIEATRKESLDSPGDKAERHERSQLSEIFSDPVDESGAVVVQKQSFSSFNGDKNPESKKRSFSSTDMKVASARIEPEAKKLCSLTCYNYTALDKFTITVDPSKTWMRNSDIV